MEHDEQRRTTEAIILASPEPIPLARLARLIRTKQAVVKALVGELNGAYVEQGRSFEICEIAGGYQIRTLPEFAAALQSVQIARPLRLSPAALETLAIVAYRQPVTRAEVEHVRGVDAGAVMRNLLERNLVRITGHREVPGRPMLYGTTKRFLEVLGLASLDDLPTLRDLAELAPETAIEGAPEDEDALETVAEAEAVDPEEQAAKTDADAEGLVAGADDSEADVTDVDGVASESETVLAEPEERDTAQDASGDEADIAALEALADAKPVGEPH